METFYNKYPHLTDIPNGTVLKICNKCHNLKPVEQFKKFHNSKKKYTSKCLECYKNNRFNAITLRNTAKFYDYAIECEYCNKMLHITEERPKSLVLSLHNKTKEHIRKVMYKTNCKYKYYTNANKPLQN